MDPYADAHLLDRASEQVYNTAVAFAATRCAVLTEGMLLVGVAAAWAYAYRVVPLSERRVPRLHAPA
eukprot:2103523-Rhodomonas_salina.2